jgi:hypothetical protein
MFQRQEDQFRQIRALFKFKDSENGDGNGESSGNVDHTFLTNASTKAFQTRPLRLNFPWFDKDDHEGWCYRASQFFDYYVILDQHRFTISGFHMEWKALVWF